MNTMKTCDIIQEVTNSHVEFSKKEEKKGRVVKQITAYTRMFNSNQIEDNITSRAYKGT